VASAVNAAWAALGHSNLRIDLRFLEPVFITPRLHRLHHVPGTSQQNLGTIFSFWDRLRGTLANDEALPLAPIGVPGEIESYPQGWIRQLVEPLRFTVFGAVAPGCG
jgi:sterol desaturase/sphingolipid hydroxylase (fatty acid hydroxylase superfamily)